VFYAEIAESGFDQGRCLALLIAKLGTRMDGPAGADDLFGDGLGFVENFTPVLRNHDRKLRTWTGASDWLYSPSSPNPDVLVIARCSTR
jgi:hypothetical protein